VGKTLKKSEQKSDVCEECNVGFYNPIPGHDESCIPCKTAGVGASECKACEPGKYIHVNDNDNDSDNCKVCGLGNYTDIPDLSVCKICT